MFICGISFAAVLSISSYTVAIVLLLLLLLRTLILQRFRDMRSTLRAILIARAQLKLRKSNCLATLCLCSLTCNSAGLMLTLGRRGLLQQPWGRRGLLLARLKGKLLSVATRPQSQWTVVEPAVQQSCSDAALKQEAAADAALADGQGPSETAQNPSQSAAVCPAAAAAAAAATEADWVRVLPPAVKQQAADTVTGQACDCWDGPSAIAADAVHAGTG